VASTTSSSGPYEAKGQRIAGDDGVPVADSLKAAGRRADTPVTTAMTALGLLALRLALAVVLVAHGLHDVFGFFSGAGVGPGGLDQMAARFARLGLEPGFVLAVLAGVTQLAGGLLVGVGFATRWAAAALTLHAFVMLWTQHASWGFFLNWIGDPGRGHGIEYVLVQMGAFVCLILAGGGEASADHWRARNAESRSAARDRIRRKF
jgi:putative oxidoreductase